MFHVRGAKVQDQDAFTFTSARKGFSMIVATSPKALEMTAKAPALYNLEEKAAVPQTQWIPSENFSSHSATLTTIKCIKDMGTPVAGVEEIDSQNTLWQLQLGSRSGATSGYNTPNPEWIKVMVSSDPP